MRSQQKIDGLNWFVRVLSKTTERVLRARLQGDPVCLICDEFRKRRDLADARRMLLAARREPRSIDRAHLDKVEKDLDEFEAAAKKSGMTLLEVVVAVAIVGMIGYITAVWWRNQEANELYLHARSAMMEDSDRLFNSIRRAWDSRDRDANGGGATLGPVTPAPSPAPTPVPGLQPQEITISMKPKGGAGPNVSSNWRTECRNLPARLGLSAAQKDAIESVAQGSCGLVCPDDQRPVIVETRDDAGGVAQQIPSDSAGTSRGSLLALGACFIDSTSYVEVILRTAIMRSDGKIQDGERRFQFKKAAEYGSGVDVLR